MSEDPTSQPESIPSEAALAALRKQYSARQVIESFHLLGLPVCDDQAVITQVAQRERARRQQDSQSHLPAVRQSAAAWLRSYDLLAMQASRRELLLLVQEEVNQTLT